jgi:hypothetical protein
MNHIAYKIISLRLLLDVSEKYYYRFEYEYFVDNKILPVRILEKLLTAKILLTAADGNALVNIYNVHHKELSKLILNTRENKWISKRKKTLYRTLEH